MLVLLELILIVGITTGQECGTLQTQGRIVGGTEVGYFKYPWFAALHEVGDITYQICAGSLITTRHVLSAAHCFPPKREGEPKDYYEITLGLHNRCTDNNPKKETFRSIEVVVHENYNQDPKDLNDIALMTLNKPANFVPICLPPRGDAIIHVDHATIMGFGLSSFGSSNRPCEMNEGTVQIFTNEECEKNMTLTHFATDVLIEKNSAFCAGLIKGGVDTCQGDSGGPILTERDGRYVQEGLVSYGYGCANRQSPGVYTQVSFFIDWLNEHIPEGLPTSVISSNVEEKPKSKPKSKKKRKRGPLKKIISAILGK